jgi:hypothetical protein
MQHLTHFGLAGHTITFALDGDIWKSKIDHGIWSPGQPDLSEELQETVDTVVVLAGLNK